MNVNGFIVPGRMLVVTRKVSIENGYRSNLRKIINASYSNRSEKMKIIGHVFEQAYVECSICRKRYKNFGWFEYHVASKHVPREKFKSFQGNLIEGLPVIHLVVEDDGKVILYMQEEMDSCYRGKLKIKGTLVGAYRGLNPSMF